MHCNGLSRCPNHDQHHHQMPSFSVTLCSQCREFLRMSENSTSAYKTLNYRHDDDDNRGLSTVTRKAFRAVSTQPASYLPRSNPSTLLKGAWKRNDKQGDVVQLGSSILGTERTRLHISDSCWPHKQVHKGLCSMPIV